MADKYELDELISEIESEENAAPKKSWSMDEIDSLLGIGTPSEDKEIKIDFTSPDTKVEEPVEGETFANLMGIEEEESDDEVDEPIDLVEEVEELADEKPSKKEKKAKKEKKEKKSRGSFFKKILVVEDDEDDLDELEEAEDLLEESVDDIEEELEEELEETVEEKKRPELDIPKVDPNIEHTRTFKDLMSSDPVEEKTKVIELPSIEEEDFEEEEVPSKEQEVAPLTEEEKMNRRALAQKTIGIYPTRNENINHQIVTEKVEKSPEGAADNYYRERFFNVPKQNLERTADYEAIHEGDIPLVERGGLIMKKSKFKNTADLESVPTIISADAELSNFDKTIVAMSDKNVVEREDPIDGQIKISGFGDEEELEQVDEENAEVNLKERRDQKIAEFKLDADFDDLDYDVEDDEEIPVKKLNLSADALMANFIDDEYEEESDKGRIRDALQSATKNTIIFAAVQAVLTLIAIIITAITNKNGGNLDVIGGGAFGCSLINIIVLLIASACGLSTLVRGFKALTAKKPNAASGTLVVVLSVLLEDLAIMIFSSDSYTTAAIYTAAGCFTLLLNSIARLVTLLRANNNFKFVIGGTQLYSTEKISGEDDAFEIGRGLLIGEPEVCYNARMERPSYFIENSFEDDPADTYTGKYILFSAAAGLLCALIFGIVHHSFVFAFGAFAAVCCMTIPTFAAIASNIALLFANLEFNKNGAAIVGHRAVEDSTDANAYVLDATDIFKKGSSSIVGIKMFHQMKIDDAILYAAALIIESGGPLADIFDNVILGKKDLLPPVESLAYEEKLGLSAWIHGRRVLVGTRDLLINHNVEDVPDKAFEAQYIHDGRKVVYLAIAGKISAMFVVKYQPDKNIARYLRSLDKAGVSILIRSVDCNITEEMVCEYFNLPLSAVKILSPVSGDIYKRYRDEDVESAPAGIIHNGTLESSVRAFCEARDLNADIEFNKLVTLVYAVIAFVLFLLVTIFGGSESMGITGGQIVLFQLFFGAIACAIPVLKRKFNK